MYISCIKVSISLILLSFSTPNYIFLNSLASVVFFNTYYILLFPRNLFFLILKIPYTSKFPTLSKLWIIILFTLLFFPSPSYLRLLYFPFLQLFSTIQVLQMLVSSASDTYTILSPSLFYSFHSHFSRFLQA